MTRSRIGSLSGQATPAALDMDLRVGGRSGSLLHLRGSKVEPSSRTSPYYSSDEPTPARVNSCAKRGDSDSPGRVQPYGGGEQVSAEAGAGATQDLHAGGALAGSTNCPAGHQAPASRPRESTQPLLPFDARNARNAHPSTGALLKAETPEAVSHQSEDVLVLASTMAPAEAQKFLVLVRLEQHMRIQNNTTMADGCANLIFKILDTQFFGASGSGPSAGSSGGSTGMGASSMIVGAASLASLSCDATMQAPKQPAQFKLSASEAAASVANNDADKPSTWAVVGRRLKPVVANRLAHPLRTTRLPEGVTRVLNVQFLPEAGSASGSIHLKNWLQRKLP